LPAGGADAVDAADMGLLRHVAAVRGSANSANLIELEPALSVSTRIVHAAPLATALRRACAMTTAMAVEAVRVSAESARLVSTMGTRAPSTMPAT
jgi:hypothetical protein